MGITRLGIIGCGGMAKAHTQHFDELRDRMRVVATVDIDKDRAEGAASLFEDARAETDYKRILDDVDAVLIALPHHLHHPVGLECFAAGKHVLMEKPLANTERECQEIIAASEKSERTLMIGYVMRFNPMVRELKRLIEEKTYGECFQVSIWTEQLTYRDGDTWLNHAKLLGGGQLFSHGCHYIDLLLWYLGNPVEGTHIGTNLGTPWMEREGTSNVSMKFEQGRLGYHFGTWGARGTRLRYSFHAHCEKGMLEIAFHDGNLILHGGGEEDARDRKEEILMHEEEKKNLGRQMSHFLDCVETGQEPEPNGRDSLQGLRVIWRMYEAEDAHRIADLKGLGLERKHYRSLD